MELQSLSQLSRFFCVGSAPTPLIKFAIYVAGVGFEGAEAPSKRYPRFFQ